MNTQMHMRRYFHSIADDHKRGALLWAAVNAAREQARGDFFHALLIEGVDDESLTCLANDAWATYARHIEFDYPQFAQGLFLRAYQSAYRAYLLEGVSGQHRSASGLVAAIEAEIARATA